MCTMLDEGKTKSRPSRDRMSGKKVIKGGVDEGFVVQRQVEGGEYMVDLGQKQGECRTSPRFELCNTVDSWVESATQVWQQVRMVQRIQELGMPNVYGLRIPIKTNWNVELLHQLVTSTSDREVVQFLTYGWPLNHDGRQVSITMENHTSANMYLEQMQRYVEKEWALGCLLGLFLEPPWE